jgi:hypothetical protein
VRKLNDLRMSLSHCCILILILICYSSTLLLILFMYIRWHTTSARRCSSLSSHAMISADA